MIKNESSNKHDTNHIADCNHNTWYMEKALLLRSPSHSK